MVVIAGLGVTALVYQKGGIIKAPSKIDEKNKIIEEENKLLFKGTPSQIGKAGETLSLGQLQFDFYNTKESSYLSSEIDAQQQKITKNYLAAQIQVFNSGSEKTEQLLIGLEDDKGNRYRPDFSAPYYIPDIRGFGQNMMIFPRIIQDGYIFFTGIDKDAKEFQLIFTTMTSGEKVAFKFER